jgi:zinc protease
MVASPASALRPERVALSNGLVVLHNRAAANPSVVMRALIRGGASREGAADQGLANLTGRMLRQGSQNIGKSELAEELDGMGAGLSIDVGYAVTSASIKCLSGDVPRAAELLGEVIQRPTFPPEEVERVRGQLLTDLTEMEDNTRVIAERGFRMLAYPADHPYHRLTVGERETVAKLGQGDLQAFHASWYGPNQTTLIVVGDLSLDQTLETIERVFGAWAAARPDPVQATLPASDPPEPNIATYPMHGKTQADIVFGTPTIERKSPDFYALSFANHILGRMYFMGRFGEKVRDEQGLAYYAYSELHSGYGSGVWAVRAGVNPRNLDQALSSIRAELWRFLADGPTEAEQTDGVSSLLGGLPRQLETNEGAAAVMGEMELYDLGLDYLEKFPEILRSLTREQVITTARRWLKPDALVGAIAGPPSAPSV